MNIKCVIGKHKWKGCTCSLCGKMRGEQHDWNGCKCRICGSIRNDAHSWDGCKCRICGTERHLWQGCKCEKCGAVRDDGHDWEVISTSKDVETLDDGYFLNGFGQSGPIVERVTTHCVSRCRICGRQKEEDSVEVVES